MLVMSVAIFTLVAVMGLGMVFDIARGQGTPKFFAVTHAVFAALGSALVIWVALQGDNRVWINIGLAVVIILLGLTLSFKRAKGPAPKGILALHGGLAVICYLILAYNAFTTA
jgi:cell division protein FtsW (lipid II flippase)